MKNQNITIKDWNEEDRPREKMLQKGVKALSDAELIAIIIGSGTRTESAVELSRRLLLMSSNDLSIVSKKSVAELQKLKGIGPAKAISISAAIELGVRLKDTKPEKKSSITSSKAIFEEVQPIYYNLQHEEFWLIILNRANHITDKLQLSKGGISGTVVDVRMIIKAALDRVASSIIIVHNHPSGNLIPSDQDKSITEQISSSCSLMGIKLLDHIIVYANEYYSFSDNGEV